ncbi:MAG: glycosyltransferase [Thermoplasmata archaeon]
MLPIALVVVLLLLAVITLLYQGVAIWFAYEMPRVDPAPGASTRAPRVSVVIAARNEGDELAATLDSLLAQDEPLAEIVVVDGASTDATAAIARARAPRVRLLEEPSLPPEWVGKSWACATGAAATRAEWILFLDADVHLHPAAVRSVLDWATRESADLASIGTRIEMGTSWERIVMPFYVQMVLTHFRSPHVNRDRSTAAVANGQFLLARRSVYASLGGHAAIRSHLLEDVALAERFRGAGRCLRFAWAPDLAATRMYRSRVDMAEGLLKTVHGTEYSTSRQLGRIAGVVGLFLLPLGLLPLGLALGDLALIIMGAVLYVALFGKHLAFARALGSTARAGLAYPVAAAFYVLLLARSIQHGGRKGTVRWKGREYGVRPPPPAPKT